MFSIHLWDNNYSISSNTNALVSCILMICQYKCLYNTFMRWKALHILIISNQIFMLPSMQQHGINANNCKTTLLAWILGQTNKQTKSKSKLLKLFCPVVVCTMMVDANQGSWEEGRIIITDICNILSAQCLMWVR